MVSNKRLSPATALGLVFVMGAPPRYAGLFKPER